MVKKRKGKPRINAIDRYLQQKKYRETQIKHKEVILKNPKVVIPKIKPNGFIKLIENSKFNQNGSRNEKIMAFVPDNRRIKQKLTEKVKCEKYAKKLTKSAMLNEYVTKAQNVIKRSSNHSDSGVKVEKGSKKQEIEQLKKGKKQGNETIEKLLSVKPSHTFPQQPIRCECIVDDSNTNKEVEIVEEKTPIVKKYQPYMDRIRLLTPEMIIKFIKDNQEYYVKLRKETELRNMTRINDSRKNNDDGKNMFKCNPFNSEQQMTMYLTLREIFNVAPSEFQKCRIFFTDLLPEISCQLFAETFRIQQSLAPRLIKRLYPNPVCLV